MAYATYRKTAWVNDIPPSIDDANLLKMEEGIYQNSLRINDLLTICERQDRELDAVRADISALGKRMTTAENDIKGIKSDITTINNTKANKNDVPTNDDFNTALDKKLDKTTYNTYVNTTAPNTYRKKSDSYTKSEVDSKVNGKLGNAGDTGNGNYRFNGNLVVNGPITTGYEYYGFDNDNSQGFGAGGYKLYVQSGNPRRS